MLRRFLSLFQSVKQSSIIGVDISSTSIKLLEISKNHETYQVERWARISIPKDIVVAKQIKFPDKLAGIIKQTITELNFSKNAAIALPDTEIISRTFVIDNTASEIELEAQILIYAEKHISYPIAELYFDYEVLTKQTEVTKKLDVFLVASKIAAVNKYSNILHHAGLKTKIVDVERCAHLRSYLLLKAQHLYPSIKSEAAAIFNIGYERMVLTVIYGDKCIFTCSSFVNSCMTKEILMQKIERNLKLYSATEDCPDIDKIILAGEINCLAQLVLMVAQATSVSAMIANPFEQMSFALGVNKENLMQYSPEFFTCCGLALRSF